MSDAKRHHYLPESYQKGFMEGPGLWVYDIERDTYRAGTPHDIGVQGYYNAFEDKDGKRDFTVEKELANIEGEAATLIRDKVGKQQPLTLDEKVGLSVFIAFLMCRTPDFEATTNKSSGFMIEKLTAMAWRDEAAAQQSLDQLKEKTGEEPGVTAAEMVEAHKSGDFKLRMMRNHSLDMMLRMVPEFSEIFATLDWTFIVAPAGSHFITTDSPLLITPPKNWNHNLGSGVGLLIRGALKIVPLTKGISLVMYDRGMNMGYKLATPEVVEGLNLQMAWNAYRFIIAATEAQLRRLVEVVKAERKERGSKWGGTKLTIF